MENLLFIEYPKCSTCQKAKQWLINHNISFESRHIVEQNPTYEELKFWSERFQRPLKNFFNTSGMLYKSLGLKEKLPLMGADEQLKLLSSNGMLVKRPLIISNTFILIGFKENEWGQKLPKYAQL